MCPNPLGVSVKSFQTPTLILKLSLTISKWDFKRYSHTCIFPLLKALALKTYMYFSCLFALVFPKFGPCFTAYKSVVESKQ